MTTPNFSSVEQLGHALTKFWLEYIESNASKDQMFERLVASGDDDEACLSHLEWKSGNEESAAMIGFPSKDLSGQPIQFPESISDCFRYAPLIDLAQRFAVKLGISSDPEYLADSQLTSDLVDMLIRALNYEMLQSMEAVRALLVGKGFKFSHDAEVGIYRHDYVVADTLDEYENTMESLEFSTTKLGEDEVLSSVADVLFSTDQRKKWFKSHELFVVECEL